MPFCTECGARIEPSHKFCNNCGTPTHQSTPPAPRNNPPPPPPAYTAPANDPIITTITILRKMKSLGRSDNYFLTASSQRLIIAPLSKEMINRSVKQAQETAKAEGKGFFGQWKAQLGTSFNYADQYLGVPSDTIINQNPGSITLQNQSITQIQLKSRNEHHNDSNVSIYTLYIRSNQGTYEYRLDTTNGVKELLDLYKGRTKSNVHFW